jgi:DNA-binding beta-propeller fold protein YncE
MQMCALTYAHGNVYSTELSPANGANYMIGRTSTHTDRLATVAGGGGTGSAPDGGKASGGLLHPGEGACGIAVDHHGNLFTLGQDQIRVVAGSTGTFYGQQMLAGHVYTIAGTGVSGYAGDGGPAVDAELRGPSGMAVDSSGNVIFADNGNQRVRVVAAATGTFYGVPMAAGDIYTVAGTGAKGYTGDGCAATTAQIKITFPSGVAGIQIDHAGNLVIADTGNFALRVVAAANGTFYRTAMQAGHIYTVGAGHLPAPGTGCGVGADRKAVVRPGFRAIYVAVDRAGNLVTTGGGYLWVDAIATGTFYGHRMSAHHIVRVMRIGPVRTFTGPVGLTVDGAGNIVLSASSSRAGGPALLRVLANRKGRDFGRAVRAGKVYKVAGNGFTAYSGDGGRAAIAQFVGLAGLAADSRGNIVLADSGNDRLRVIASRTGQFYGRRMIAGDIYTVAGNGRLGTSRRQTGPAKGIEVRPDGVAARRNGDLAITGPVGGRGRHGLMWLLPAHNGTEFGRRVVAGNAYVLDRCGKGFCAHIGQPAFDAAGNLLVNQISRFSQLIVIAVRNGTFYGRAMKAGHRYVLAMNGLPSRHTGPVTVDHHGNVLIGGRNIVRVFAARSGTFYGITMTAGNIYKVAFHCCLGDAPFALAVDAAGNVVMTSPHRAVVTVLAVTTGTFYGVAMTAGQVATIAGNGTVGFAGDGGSALAAELGGPAALTITGSGDILIGDALRIRSISG